jgi:hypothetical protein
MSQFVFWKELDESPSVPHGRSNPDVHCTTSPYQQWLRIILSSGPGWKVDEIKVRPRGAVSWDDW